MEGTHQNTETDAREDPTSDDGGHADAPDEMPETEGDGVLAAVREFLAPVVRAWMVVVRAFSWLVARVMALVLFVFAFIPYGIVMRVVKFDPLDRSFDSESDSYWSEFESTNRDIQSFRKQY